jgi:hypothetical protein
VCEASKRQGYVLHVWIVLVTVLALAALYLTETLTARRPPVEASSTLEPAFSQPGGTYDRDIQLRISAPNPGDGKRSDVLFTLDGSVPTHASGAVYTHPIHLSAATPAVTVVRARAVLPGGKLGPVVSASYFVGVPATLPMMSLIVDPDDLWDTERGIYANPLETGQAWERPADVTYVDRDRRSGFHIPAGIRVHGAWSRYFDKKSLRLYFRQEYGASRLEYPLFAGSQVRSFKRLVLHSGGEDLFGAPDSWNWTLMRNRLADSLAFELDGIATHSQPVLVFINGEPWGIYQIRERIDRYFLADHYGIQAADILDSPEYAWDAHVAAGDRENWDRLMQFLETHDLADPANYAHVQSQVDVANLIDYCILQIYAADADWPQKNVRQFRPRVQGGRWQWIFWDTDLGFGTTLHSQVSDNVIQQLLEYDHPGTGGRDVLLLRRLLENPAFFDRFLSRAADLLNTTLAPQSVIAHVDGLAAELEPDIHYEMIRWSSPSNWESSVQELRDFARRRPDFVRQHMVEAFDLDGTAQLVFNPPASGSGSVAVNGTLVPDLPWQGIYFQHVPVQVTAAPAPGYRFAGWDPLDLPQTPTITLTVTTSRTIAPRFEATGDDAPRPGDVIFAAYRMDEGSQLDGDRFELLVMRPGGVDLRGWRVTDNDTKTATDEGSLIFGEHPAFARVPRGTTIRIVVTQTVAQAGASLPEDDLSTWDRHMVLHAGNGHLDAEIDPGFNLGPDDNLVLLAPGPTEAFGDDQGIAFVAEGSGVTPASFGVLVDGVWPTPASAGAPPGRQTRDSLSTWLLALIEPGSIAEP